MFSFSPSQGLVEHILVISHGIMIGNIWKERKVMLDEKMGKVAKGEIQKEKKKRRSVPLCSLRFYVERAWNQKKLSIGD